MLVKTETDNEFRHEIMRKNETEAHKQNKYRVREKCRINSSVIYTWIRKRQSDLEFRFRINTVTFKHYVFQWFIYTEKFLSIFFPCTKTRQI